MLRFILFVLSFAPFLVHGFAVQGISTVEDVPESLEWLCHHKFPLRTQLISIEKRE
jgi:hypothetical protein